jgi:hypothetical protein
MIKLANTSYIESIQKLGMMKGIPITRFFDRIAIERAIDRFRLKPLTEDEQLRCLNTVVTFREENNTVATKTETQGSKLLIASKPIAVATSSVRQVLLHGGMVGPHLHHEGKIYKLSAEQWNNFANIALEELRNKFAQVKTISFDNFVKVAEAVEEVI